MRSVRHTIDMLLEALLASLMTVMVLGTLLQIIARIVDLNVPFTEELTIYSMMWITLFGSAYTFGLKKHIAIDVLSGKIKERNRWKLKVLVEVIIAVFAILILMGGGIRLLYVTFKLGQVSSVMQVPKGWIYLAIPVSGLVTLIYNWLNISDLIVAKKDDHN